LLDKKADEYVNEFNNQYNSILAIKEFTGEGVVINLIDSTKPLSFEENPNLMVIHNLDLLSIVNELWNNGAKAISINNQRVTANTEFNCIGSTILINNTRVFSPFTVKAVGDPEKLSEGFLVGYIHKYNLEKYGITYTIQKKKNVIVPASSNSMSSSG
jgi:uncharacterized protein YlxW (UPF0749 family)